MKAAICREFGANLSVETVALAAPEAGEVEIDVKACAICHSDLTYISGDWGGVLPAVYGHEAAGVVRRVGAGVNAFAPGDPVVATLIRSCGQCPSCSGGVPTSCRGSFARDLESPLRDSQGVALTHGLRVGAFAERIIVDSSQIVGIPASIPFDAASLLACGVITGLGAVLNTAQMRPGADVAVIGLGGVGINAVQGAAIGGARRIIGLDLSSEKCALARGFGATDTLNAASPDMLEQLYALTGDAGVDYVFICAGAKPAIESAQAMLAPGGTAVVVGMPATGVMAEYDPTALASNGQRIIGSKMGSARIRIDIPYLVSLYQQGRLRLDELISGRFALEEINEAIAQVKSGGALRNVIVFD